MAAIPQNRRSLLLLLSLLGVIVCFYAYYVETAKQNDSNFTAACDISASISCSKVFSSKYVRTEFSIFAQSADSRLTDSCRSPASDITFTRQNATYDRL